MKKILLLTLAFISGVSGLRPTPAPSAAPPARIPPPQIRSPRDDGEVPYPVRRAPPSGRSQRVDFDDEKKVVKVGNKGRIDQKLNITNFSFEKTYDNSSLTTNEDVKMTGKIKIHVPFKGEKTAKISFSDDTDVELDDFHCDGPLDIGQNTIIKNGTIISGGATTVLTPAVIGSTLVITSGSVFTVNGNSSVTLNNMNLSGIITITTQASAIFTGTTQVLNLNVFTVTSQGSVTAAPGPLATDVLIYYRRHLQFTPAYWAGDCIYEQSSLVMGSGHMYCNAVNSGIIIPTGGVLTFSSLTLTPESIIDLGADPTNIITVQEDIMLNGTLRLSNSTRDGQVLIESFFGQIYGSFAKGGENLVISNTTVVYKSPVVPSATSHARLIYILVPSIIGGVVLLVVAGIAIRNHRLKEKHEEIYYSSANPLLNV